MRTHYDSLDGLRLPPWRVVGVEGEWGLGAPSTPLLERVHYRVFPDEEPDSLVAVHFERLEPPAPPPPAVPPLPTER